MKKIIKSMLCLGVLLSLGVFAADDYRFKIQILDKANTEFYKITEDFFEEIEKETDGQIKVLLVPSNLRVVMSETLDAMRLGLIDGHISTAALLSGKEPALGMMANILGAWDDSTEANEFMQSAGNDILAEIYSNNKVKLLSTFPRGAEAFLSKRAVNSADDLSGTSVRIVDNTAKDILVGVGAKTEYLDFSETEKALKDGKIDAVDNATLGESLNIAKTANNIVYPGFHFPVMDISMSQRTWNSLPEDVQAKVQSISERLAKKLTDYYIEDEKKALDAANKIASVKAWTPEARTALRQKAQPFWLEASKQSADTGKAYDAITTFLKDKGKL